MPGKSRSQNSAEKVTLVSPDGSRKYDVVAGSPREVGLRFDGYLPPEQAKLEAPPKPEPSAPKTVGTGSVEEG